MPFNAQRTTMRPLRAGDAAYRASYPTHAHKMSSSPPRAHRALSTVLLAATIALACRDDQAPRLQAPGSLNLHRSIDAQVSVWSSEASVGQFIDVTITGANVDSADIAGLQGVIAYDTSRLVYQGPGLGSDSVHRMGHDAQTSGSLAFAAVSTSGLETHSFSFRFVVKAPQYLEGAVVRFGEATRLSDGATVIGSGNAVAITVEPPNAPSPAMLSPGTAETAPIRANVEGGTPLIFGDVTRSGALDMWDYKTIMRWIVGLDPAPSFSDSVATLANVAPANLPGLGGSGDAMPPGLEQDCTKRYSIADAARIALEITGAGQEIVGEPVPPAFAQSTLCAAAALQPPDSVPAWFADDTSVTTDGGYVRNIIKVIFVPGTSAAMRQAAIDLVGGTVVGGTPLAPAEGEYLVLVPTNGVLSEMRRIRDLLEQLPQVEAAGLEIVPRSAYATPVDGAGWTSWALAPDRVTHRGLRWGLEAIDAPHAWGCSTGSATLKVAVVDSGYPHIHELSTVLDRTALGSAANQNDALAHGIGVASVMSAPADDGVGMTGVLWRSQLKAYMMTRGHVFRAYLQAAEWGATVVNFSFTRSYNIDSTTPPQDSAISKNDVIQLQTFWRNMLASLQARGIRRPLLVVSAGNHGHRGWTTFNSAYPTLRRVDSLGVLVVGHARLGPLDQNGRRSYQRHPYAQLGTDVSIYAPGDSVGAYAFSGLPEPRSGSSFAAPFVSGSAGLLFSFGLDTREEVYAALTKGAARAGRGIDTLSDGRVVYMLNAYESLQIAAEAPHARLCGNRYYEQAPGTWAIQRASGPIGVQAEYLTGEATASGARRTWIEHGGKYFVVRDQTTGYPSQPGVYNAVRGYYFEHGPGGFSLRSFLPPGPFPDPYPWARYDSLDYYNPTRRGVAHGGKQVAYVTGWTDPMAPVIRESQVQAPTGTSYQTDTIGFVPLAQSPGARWYLVREMLLCQISDALDDTCNDAAQWYRMDSTYTDLDGRAFVLFPEYSPFNDSVFVAAVQTDYTRTLSDWISEVYPTPAEGCGNFPSEGPGLGWWKVLDSRCKRVNDASVTSTSTSVYGLGVPAFGQAPGTAVLQPISSHFSSTRIYWFNIPEGNREWVIASGTPTETGAVPGDCKVEWRSRASSVQTSLLSSGMACRNDPWEGAGSALRAETYSRPRLSRFGGKSRMVASARPASAP